MPLPNPGMSFTPFDPLPASDLNDMVENIEALQDWSAYTAASLPGSLLAADAVKSRAIDWAATGAGDSGGIWWEEIGRTTLGVAGDTISVASLASRAYIRAFIKIINTGATEVYIRFNGDTGNNYSMGYNFSGGSPGTLTSQNKVGGHALSGTGVTYGEIGLINRAASPKSGQLLLTGTLGSAAAAPRWDQFYFMWSNATNAISQIDVINLGAGDFAIGSELVILGHN